MHATLTELRRDTSRVMRAVYRGEEVILTDNDHPVARIQPFIPTRMVSSVEEARTGRLSDEAITEAVREARDDYAGEVAGDA